MDFGVVGTDLDDVLKIERVSFPTPWTRTLFEQELVMPFAKAFIAVEVDSQRVWGYMCFWLAAEARRNEPDRSALPRLRVREYQFLKSATRHGISPSRSPILA